MQNTCNATPRTTYRFKRELCEHRCVCNNRSCLLYTYPLYVEYLQTFLSALVTFLINGFPVHVIGNWFIYPLQTTSGRTCFGVFLIQIAPLSLFRAYKKLEICLDTRLYVLFTNKAGAAKSESQGLKTNQRSYIASLGVHVCTASAYPIP